MREDLAFEVPGPPQITAAMLGISRLRWESCRLEQPLSEVAQIMARNRFDVLPICDSDGKAIGYYQTNDLGCYTTGSIQKHTIDSQADCIYYKTTLDDLARLFSDSQRFFYFLTHHQDIVGMVSKPHLRSRPAYLYFYSHLLNLEKNLADWLSEVYSDAFLIEELEKHARYVDEHGQPKLNLSARVLENYRQDSKNHTENTLSAYLYLSTLLYLVKWLQWNRTLGYSNNQFDDIVTLVTKVRNEVDHPVKNSLGPKTIWAFLQLSWQLERQLEHLRLLSAYVQTNYQVDEPSLTIQVGFAHAELDQWLKGQGIPCWAFITAWNPQSVQHSKTENADKNKQLENEIQQRGLKAVGGRGIYRSPNSTWLPEESFLVLGLSREDAQTLGQNFGQKAVVWGQIDQMAELVSCEPDQPYRLPEHLFSMVSPEESKQPSEVSQPLDSCSNTESEGKHENLPNS